MPAIDYEALYFNLVASVKSLANDFRSLSHGASSREKPVWMDAHDMTSELYEDTLRKETRK